MTLSASRYGARVGPYIVATASGTEAGGGPEEETTLFILKRDFRDVKLSRPWPRWMWPFRAWVIDREVRRVATRLSWKLKADLELLALIKEHATDPELDAIVARFPRKS